MDVTGVKYGIVSEAKVGYAKVYFEEDNISTDWWPIIMRGTLATKDSYPLTVNEHVVCLADHRCEEGVILGAIYNDTDTPDADAGDTKFRKLFSDGSFIEYDTAAHRLKALVQNMQVEVDGQLLVQKGSDTLKQAFTLIIESIQPIVVIYGNNPDFTKLTQALTKVNNLLK